MSLFQLGEFTLHSGAKSAWKIDCDALTDGDWEAVAAMLCEMLPPFGSVHGIPRGGIKLAEALSKRVSSGGPRLIVDDVLTTGGSMAGARTDPSDMGAVLFARGPCPEWIVPLFRVAPSLWRGTPRRG